MTGLFLAMTWMVLALAPCCLASEALTLEDAWQVVRTKRFVDLTHAFSPGIPHWKGFPDEKREILYWYEPGVGTVGSGFYSQSFTHVGQWGTRPGCLPSCRNETRTVPGFPVLGSGLKKPIADTHFYTL